MTDFIVEDPSKVPPEEKYPKMTQVDANKIREFIRKDNAGYLNTRVSGTGIKKPIQIPRLSPTGDWKMRMAMQ